MMDMEGGVTVFKSSIQVFDNTTLLLKQINEEADLPGAVGTMTQTAKVVQRNFIITGAIVLIAFAYLWRTFREPEPRYFITMWFGTPMKGTGKFSLNKSTTCAYSFTSIRRLYFLHRWNTPGYSHSGQHFRSTCRTKQP
jgi:hypothetical protein